MDTTYLSLGIHIMSIEAGYGLIDKKGKHERKSVPYVKMSGFYLEGNTGITHILLYKKHHHSKSNILGGVKNILCGLQN